MVWDLQNLNYFAIVLAAITANVISALWFGPYMFGSIWAPLVAKNQASVSGVPRAVPLVVSILTSLVVAFLLAILVGQMGGGPNNGLVVGAIAGVGIFAMSGAPHAVFSNRPPLIFILEASQTSASMVAMGVILGCWEKFLNA